MWNVISTHTRSIRLSIWTSPSIFALETFTLLLRGDPPITSCEKAISSNSSLSCGRTCNAVRSDPIRWQTAMRVVAATWQRKEYCNIGILKLIAHIWDIKKGKGGIDRITNELIINSSIGKESCNNWLNWIFFFFF